LLPGGNVNQRLAVLLQVVELLGLLRVVKRNVPHSKLEELDGTLPKICFV
jgi:hypothetical protein